MSGRVGWWWLSFSAETSTGFRGVAILEAEPRAEAAIEAAWDLGLNPGGAVLAVPLLVAPPKRFRGKLLGRKLANSAAAVVHADQDAAISACSRCNDPDPKARLEHRARAGH